jgi:hypothetical protein
MIVRRTNIRSLGEYTMEAEIGARVTRGIEYSQVSKRFIYRATVRAFLKRGKEEVKDIAIIRLRAASPATLEKKYRR